MSTQLRRGIVILKGMSAASFRRFAVASVFAFTSVVDTNGQQLPPPSDSVSSNIEDGIGQSYWGTIPPVADSTSQVMRSQPMPVWEGMLVWPYRVITFPLKLVSIGIGESVEYLDEKKVIYKVGRLLGPREGPLGVQIQLEAGGLSGFGGGAAIQHDAFLGSGNRFRLYGTTTVTGTHRASMGLRFPTGATGQTDVGVGYRQRPNARYFGLGPESAESAKSYYGQNLAWLGTSYLQRVFGNVYLGGDVLLSSVDAKAAREDYVQQISDIFAGELPLGYGSTSKGISIGASLSHVTAIETGRPTRGGSHRIRATYFFGDDNTEFLTYRVDLQQFFRLWYPTHVLALRIHGSWIDPVGNSEVPFQRLMTNDDPDLMRGFLDFRWRDRGMAVLSAEYRWPLWVLEQPDATGLDLYLLTDVGKVFGEVSEFDFNQLTVSYGAGLRLLGSGGFVLRLEYARSSEGDVWRLRTDQIFQFARGGFFHGRDPVPTR